MTATRPASTAPAPCDIDSPLAWRMAAVAFIAGFVVFGIIYSYGVFLTPMANEFAASRSAASAYFSIASLAFYFLSPFTGALSDRAGPRAIVAFGALCMGLGLALTALIDRLATGYVTYGLGVGIGAACVYVPAVANLGGWFERSRTTALGIAAAGTGFGGLIVPTLAAELIARYGWRAADAMLGGGSAMLLAVCALTVRPPPASPRAHVDRSVMEKVASPVFITVYVSWLLGTIALFVPFVYLPTFATRHGASDFVASLLLAILGGISVVGRLGIGALAQRWSTLSVYKCAILAMGLSYALWLVRPEPHWLVVFAVWLGLAYGVRIALVPAVLIDRFGTQNLGALLGIFFTATGIAAFVGPAVAGRLIDGTGGFAWAIAFALATGLASFAVICPLKPGSSEGA